MPRYYDRYSEFKTGNDDMKTLPYIKITEKPTDKKVNYSRKSRLDIISNDVYGSPYYGWLILLINPQYGGLESNIPYGSVLNVPFPLNATLQEYQTKITLFNNLYGIDG